jgi:hypothetical protein
MSDSPEDLGGAPLLPLLLVGRGSVVERLAAPGPDGLAQAVTTATAGAVTVQITRTDPGDSSLLDALPGLADQAQRHPVTVLALEGDLPDRWPADFEAAKAALSDGVRALKSAGTRIIAVGVSTLDPSGPSADAAAAERSAHELGLALLELSVDEGISVLDTDRIVAELGGGAHVRGFLDYDSVVHDRLVDTMVEILADYGFFEARPLVPQVGVKNR